MPLHFIRLCRTRNLLRLLMGVMLAAGFAAAEEVRPSKALDRHEEEGEISRREDWFLRGRTTAKGRVAPDLLYRAHEARIGMRRSLRAHMKSSAARSQGGPATMSAWTPLGPNPLLSDSTTSSHAGGDQDYGLVSGRATSVLVDPNDPSGNTVYVGGAFGGVWRSTNAASPDVSAVAWSPLIDDQPTLAVGAIAVQPGNSSVILVGTGEANNSGDSYYGLGVLRSADGGGSWNLISSADGGSHPFLGLAFARMAFSTAQPNLVVAATAASVVGARDGALEDSAIRGLYFSRDAGQNWSLAKVTDNGVPIAPGSASSVVYDSAQGRFYAAIRFHGLYTSADGENWTRLANQPLPLLNAGNCPANPASTVCPILRAEIAVVPGRQEMYVWLIDFNELDEGILKSLDGGTSWTRVNNLGITACGDFSGCSAQQGIYNLVLKAVPNNDGTDLYAGAVNLFKCSITSANPTCSTNSFINLTHVYGCSPIGSMSGVHPDQHDLDFRVVDKQVRMYFANDGGVYRALDGYGLTSGAQCTDARNPFESLNGTLGSMTQFVSFSVEPNDPATLLGGTQDNGSPATSSGGGSPTWINTNAGDGGYNAINPDNPSEWFSANPGVTIQRCANGIECLAQDFLYVVTPFNVGGDQGAFYTPYLLDPQNTSALIVGTCRVWRGPSDGSATTLDLLSPNFETGAAEPEAGCSGGESNLVRSLAAGGPSDASGSLVMYAGTDGSPRAQVPAGRVFVTTNATLGPGSWHDRTGAINPKGFPISSVAIDPSDSTGRTAYVAIMGFGVAHVWKTTNAGSSWKDFTANLPDAPANALAIDSSAATVYVGTDVGVFVSHTAAPFWLEVGPAEGQGGFLPNLAVTALRMVDNKGQRLLRASTYGRGIWQTTAVTLDPDFSVADGSGSQTVSPGGRAQYALTLAPRRDVFLDAVRLSCSGLPAFTACSFSPASVAAGSGGATITFSLQTTAPAAATAFSGANQAGDNGMALALLFPMGGLGLLLAGMLRQESGRGRVATRATGALMLLVLVVGCGGHKAAAPPPPLRPGTPPGTYQITVTGTSSTISRSAQVTLVVR